MSHLQLWVEPNGSGALMSTQQAPAPRPHVAFTGTAKTCLPALNQVSISAYAEYEKFPYLNQTLTVPLELLSGFLSFKLISVIFQLLSWSKPLSFNPLPSYNRDFAKTGGVYSLFVYVFNIHQTNKQKVCWHLKITQWNKGKIWIMSSFV